MKRAFAIAAVVELVSVVVLLHSAIKDFLWIHPWWHSALVAIPTIALPILALFELRHSGEANALRSEANEHRAEANRLQRQVADLTAERNNHLQQIAKNTEKTSSQAERNANTLRKHLRATVPVSEEQGSWPVPPEIVEVSDNNIVTLFTPSSYSSGRAFCVQVDCGDLEIADIPLGSCPLRLKVLRRYGPDVQLGEITRWEDRLQPAVSPIFDKGDNAYYAVFVKPGSAERRRLDVFTSRDGANSFLLEASTREKITGDNVEISKRFMAMYVEYLAAGFTRSAGGTGITPHRLFIW